MEGKAHANCSPNCILTDIVHRRLSLLVNPASDFKHLHAGSDAKNNKLILIAV